MALESLKNHPLKGTLAQFENLVATASSEDLSASEEEAAHLRRMTWFALMLSHRLSTTPIEQVSAHGLSLLNETLTQASNSLQSYLGDKSIGHINAAMKIIDRNAFQNLWALPAPVAGGAEARALLEGFSNQVQQVIDHLQEARSKAESEIATFADQMEVLKSKIDALSDAVTTQKSSALTTSAELKRDYANTERELRDQFQALIEASRSEHIKQTEDRKAQHDALTDQFSDNAKKVLSELEISRSEAAKIVQIVGNIGVTGNYQNVAQAEAASANNWRLITFGVFATAAVFGGTTLLDYGRDGISWQAAALRVLFSFVVASIAVYTGRESGRHRSNADRARRIELELASLGPFIESLPVEKRHELREKLTDKYFGGHNQISTEDKIPASDVFQLAQKGMETLGGVAKDLAKK